MIWKIGLADDWKRLHTRGSVLLGGSFTLIVGAGPMLKMAWDGMPGELRAAIPQNVQQWIAYSLFGLLFLGVRYTTIRREPKGGDDGHDHA